MPNIIVKTQAELDALPLSFPEYTIIEIHGGTSYSRINVSARRENSSVEAWENSSVEARENSSVEARENSSVVAWENSSVVAWGNSSVVAWENSSVVARENSSVVAWENSSVVARGNSSVEARGNSSVEARENSSVVARENSSVVAWENSSVVARENSSVVAWENVGVHAFSEGSTITAWGFVVVWLLAKAKVVLKSKTAQKITPTVKTGTAAWLEREGIAAESGRVVLFKRVSKDWKTQENTANETIWALGAKLDHPAWAPASGECGAGKYHACSRPYFCDEFRSGKADRYVALQIAVKDLHVWDGGSYPHKVAFRRCTVLHECNRHGKKLVSVEAGA